MSDLVTAGTTFLAQAAMNDSATFFNNANAYLGVGDSSTAKADGQTDLQAATNKLRKGMETSYPTRSSGTLTFRSLFSSSEANWAWNEVGIFNASSGGTMLARKVVSLGTKTSSESWLLTVTLAFAAS